MGKIWVHCLDCDGVLFQTWSGPSKKNDSPVRTYYKEVFQCLTCGSHFKKMELLRKGAFNELLTEDEVKLWTQTRNN